jgi:transcriptional regulator with XRE-family HTH domain
VQVTDLDDDQTFGARLRTERERLGLALHELAHLCGRVDIVQKRYEEGSLPIPVDYLQVLHRRTDARVTWIVTGVV